MSTDSATAVSLSMPVSSPRWWSGHLLPKPRQFRYERRPARGKRLAPDLRQLLAHKSDTFRPMFQWARNKLTENPDGVAELTPSSVRELAAFLGCSHLSLCNYLACFVPEKVSEEGVDQADPAD